MYEYILKYGLVKNYQIIFYFTLFVENLMKFNFIILVKYLYFL